MPARLTRSIETAKTKLTIPLVLKVDGLMAGQQISTLVSGVLDPSSRSNFQLLDLERTYPVFRFFPYVLLELGLNCMCHTHKFTSLILKVIAKSYGLFGFVFPK